MAASLPFRWSYLYPRYWGTWCLFIMMRLVTLFPLPIIIKVGSGLGWIIYKLFPSRRRIAEVNIRQAYPNHDDRQIEQLLKSSYASLGISVFESGLAWWASDDYLRAHCQIEGLEHLQQAYARGKGVILLTGHMTTLEIGAKLMALYISMSAVYKRAHNIMFNDLMVYFRGRYFNHVISNKDVRSFISCLKQGEAIWYGPDQDAGGKNIVYTPFLGGVASTLTSASRITSLTDASIVPFYPVRSEDGSGYKLVIREPLSDFPSDDVEADATKINREIESMVREKPEQYAWIHKRFKHRPEGEASIY